MAAGYPLAEIVSLMELIAKARCIYLLGRAALARKNLRSIPYVVADLVADAVDGDRQEGSRAGGASAPLEMGAVAHRGARRSHCAGHQYLAGGQCPLVRLASHQ